MIEFIVYDWGTGEILRWGDTQSEALAFWHENSTNGVLLAPIEGISEASHFVQSGELILRQEMELLISATTLIADSSDSISVRNLPIPSVIKIDNNSYEVPDGEFEFTTDLAGTYKIKAESFPYLDKEWEVVAI